MALCSSCSAPLPVHTCQCTYCGTRNDMSFAATGGMIFDRQPSVRQCPDCDIPLQTVRLDTGNGIFAIERCEKCFGLFFDVGEVQAFLDASVSPAFATSLRELAKINEERVSVRQPVRYKKCPECGVLMNRVNYASGSGVVTDQCKDHGIWLDNGELVHLMEWKRVGGQLVAEQKRKAIQEERQERISPPPISYGGGAGYPADTTTGDVVGTICSILFDTILR